MDSLLTGANAALLDSLYQQWLDDPESVASDWASLFEGQGAPNGGRYRAPQRDDASIFNPRSTSPRRNAEQVRSFSVAVCTKPKTTFSPCRVTPRPMTI